MEPSCATLSNVNNGANPRIAYNQSSNDFVVTYEYGRANGGRTSIGAKRFTINGDNEGETGGSMSPGLVASLEDSSLSNPDLVAHRGNYVLFVDDGSHRGGSRIGSWNNHTTIAVE